MKKPDSDFPHLSHASRDDVFERLFKVLNELANYVPSASQNPYWKSFVFSRLEFQDLAFSNGWMDYANEFPLIEDCFESVLKELAPVPKIALLDPRLQIEVVVGKPDATPKAPEAPTWAFPIHRQEWIKEFIEVRPATKVLLLLFQPDIQLLPKEEVLEDLRHELGHAFLYLLDLEAREDCVAADEEWKRCTQLEDFIVRIPEEPS